MTSPTHLLDANALIALVLTDHEHHQRVSSWAVEIDRFALCPVVEGALVRFLIRLGQTHATATQVLDGLHESSRCEFWADEISYRQADLSQVIGHRQVTDAYLAALAASRNAHLATLDRALAQAHPDSVVLIR